MGDCMRSRAEARGGKLLLAQLQQKCDELRELSSRPEMVNCSASEAVHAQGASVHQHRMHAWRPHTNHYKRSRHDTHAPEAADSVVGVAAIAQEDRVSWLAVGDGSHGDPTREQEATMSSRPALPPRATRSTPSPGMPGRRRYGRPPKATWQYLSEMGARQQRGRGQWPRPASAPPMRPLARSEELLREAQTEFGMRRPVCAPRNPRASPSRSGAATDGPQTPPSAPRADHHGAGARLHGRGERRRALRERQIELASALRDAEELRECSFRPLTNHAACSTSSLLYHGAGQIGESLYSRGMADLERRKLREAEGLQCRLQEEMRECSFRPAINDAACAVHAAGSEEHRHAVPAQAPPEALLWTGRQWGTAVTASTSAIAQEGAAVLSWCGTSGRDDAWGAAVAASRSTPLAAAVPFAAAPASRQFSPGAPGGTECLGQNDCAVLAMLESWRAEKRMQAATSTPVALLL